MDWSKSLNAGLNPMNNSCGEAVGTDDAMRSSRFPQWKWKKSNTPPSKNMIYRFTGLFYEIKSNAAWVSWFVKRKRGRFKPRNKFVN